MIDKRLLPILFITFVNSIGFSILIPIAPFIVEQFGGGAFLYGVVISSYSLCQFIAAPFIGSLSDRYGRKPVLIISHAGTLLSWFIFAIAFLVPEFKILNVALPLWIIIFARICDGITGGNISVAAAYVSDITKPENRTKAFSQVDAAWGLGLMIGPIIGSYSTNLGFEYFGTIAIAIAISIITLISLSLLLKESNKNIEKLRILKISVKEELRKSFQFIFSIVKYSNNKIVQNLLYERAAVSFVFVMFTSIFSLHLKDHFDMTQKNVGVIFLLVGLFMVFNQVMMVPFLIKKFKDERAIEIAVILIIIFSTLVPVFNSLTKFLIVTYFLVLGFSIHFSTLKSILIKNTPAKKHGEIVGIEESIIAFMQAIVPVVSSFMYEHYSNKIFMVTSIPLLIFMMYKYGLIRNAIESLLIERKQQKR